MYKNFSVMLMMVALLTACDNTSANKLDAQSSHDEPAKAGIVENTKQVLDTLNTKSAQLSDIFAIQQAMQRAGITPDMEQVLQEKMSHVQNQADVKAIIYEQVELTQKLQDELHQLKLQSPEGQAVTQKTINAAQKMNLALQTMNTLDLQDPNNIAAINQAVIEVQQGANAMFDGMKDFLDLAKDLGFDTQAALEKYQEYQQKTRQHNHAH